ncbi:SMC family ATPase [Leptolyngbya sp. BC1307]|uniref:AAA family ATPase n=1 Tax=Leptolyngbya sp. BC1307 TaxID=2029589 RepID=UPI000EFC88CF|nr:SMC family ATPase [Leptolyngbya sp. BC1307]
MQILSVTLTNFKTHKDRQFVFELGTNAICGENGAGKTSILEAIAWVLFNYQGSYRKEDLIRNGSQSAQARVSFISSRDSRTYEVQRSTSQGYTLFDPQLNERLPYTRTKDEVLPWLRQHLGVVPGTDLAQLFANTIGIPQGTFTADFLLPTEKRKPIFDTILKVEEYRETYRQSSSLRKYAEAQVQRLKDLIEQYEESLQSWEQLQTRQQQLQLELELGEKQLLSLETQSQQIAQQRQRLIAQAEQVQNARSQQQPLSSQITAQQQTQKRIEQSLASAQRAVAICQAQQPAHERVLTAEKQIAQLNESTRHRQQVLQQQQQSQQLLTRSQADLSRLEAQLEQFAAIEAELTGTAADVAIQTQLEAQRASLQEQAQTFANLRFQQRSLTAQLESVGQEIKQIEAELSRLEVLQPATQQIPQWEQQQHRVQEQLSRLEAAQQFERELKALAETGHAQQMEYRQQVATALSEIETWASRATLSDEAIAPIKTALASGKTLSQKTLAGIHSILSDLANQTDKDQLKQQRRDLQNQLQRAYGYQAERMGLGSQQAKSSQLDSQRQQLQRDLGSLNQQLAAEAETTAAIAQTETQLKQLNNPKGRQLLLQKNIQQCSAVQSQYQALTASRAETIQQAAAIAEQMKAFDQLDAQLQEQQQLKQTHQAGYLLYLQNQQAAQQVLPLTEENEQATVTLTQLQAQKAELDSQITALTATFDPEAFTAIDRQYAEINSQADQLRGRLPQQRQRLAELTGQIDNLSATAQKRDQAQAELKQRDRIKRFVNYARKVYKAAGPRITERYVHNISREADRLFRELLGRANVALTWSADYEITVQEGAHSRRFINLSGGEQMCAALAVRLALLKVLADIDIAFFDEPTTNMDSTRRSSLAEAIARIKSFKQLFVISHDDTFEQVTETVITVTREP